MFPSRDRLHRKANGHDMAPDRFDYKAIAATLLNGSRGVWLALPKSWLGVLTPIEAIFTAYFLNVAKKEKPTAGWVLMTRSFVKNWLGLDESQQAKLIAGLESKGLLEATTDEAGGRLLRMRFDRLDAIVADAEDATVSRFNRNRRVSYAKDRR